MAAPTSLSLANWLTC